MRKYLELERCDRDGYGSFADMGYDDRDYDNWLTTLTEASARLDVLQGGEGGGSGEREESAVTELCRLGEEGGGRGRRGGEGRGGGRGGGLCPSDWTLFYAPAQGRGSSIRLQFDLDQADRKPTYKSNQMRFSLFSRNTISLKNNEQEILQIDAGTESSCAALLELTILKGNERKKRTIYNSGGRPFKVSAFANFSVYDEIYFWGQLCKVNWVNGGCDHLTLMGITLVVRDADFRITSAVKRSVRPIAYGQLCLMTRFERRSTTSRRAQCHPGD